MATLKAEQLAYWYLRLNGFLTVTNFIIHPDEGSDQKTDVDVLGIRFPHRAELLLKPMTDHHTITHITTKPLIVIAEVKKERCDLNGPWTKPELRNMQRVLRVLGVFRDQEVDSVAARLYSDGVHDGDCYTSLLCLGGCRNGAIAHRFPNVPQILWGDILSFIYRRFAEYRTQKANHRQWDSSGRLLWKSATELESESQFISYVDSILE